MKLELFTTRVEGGGSTETVDVLICHWGLLGRSGRVPQYSNGRLGASNQGNSLDQFSGFVSSSVRISERSSLSDLPSADSSVRRLFSFCATSLGLQKRTISTCML